ncbi:MAG TPA: hypothetical protein VIM37_00150 [Candidatus Microsaccharimonas sp.]|jgi:hypothetical protein
MALSVGDKVKNKYNIDGGMFGTDVPSDSVGKIIAMHWVTDKVDVQFSLSYGRETTVRGIKMSDVKKA